MNGMRIGIQMKKINLLFTILFLIPISITGIFIYKQMPWVKTMVKESKSDAFNQYFETQADKDGWILVGKSKWQMRNAKGRGDYYAREVRRQHIKTKEIEITFEGIDKFKSYTRENDDWKNDPIVYIGEWEYDEQLGKNIRLIKRQGLKYGAIRSTYETKDEKNKDIPPMPLKLIREDGTFFRGSNTSKEEDEKIIEELRKQGYVID